MDDGLGFEEKDLAKMTWNFEVKEFESSRLYMGVSLNGGTPQIIHFDRVFHYKPSILRYHHFRTPPYSF